MNLFDNIVFDSQSKRMTKMIINSDRINAIKKVEIPEFDDEEHHIIQNYHKNLLIHAMNKNNSNEVGMLVDLRDWTSIIVDGTENGILLKTNERAKKLLNTAPINSLLFFHNHPKNSCFSERDLDSFITSDSIKMMSVICNNGRQYFLLKTEDFKKENALRKYNEIFLKNEDNCVKEFLRICRTVNLVFIYGGEV